MSESGAVGATGAAGAAEAAEPQEWVYRGGEWVPSAGSPWKHEDGDVDEIMRQHGYHCTLDVPEGEYARGVMMWARSTSTPVGGHPPYVVMVDDPALHIHEVQVWTFPDLLGLMAELRAAGYSLEE